MVPGMPATVGRYRIQSEIGRGAMGAVYRAEDPRLGRTVAVKMISSSVASGIDPEEIAARFEREARVAARLQHPNVVAVYDVGSEGDQLYLVMELVEGDSLAHRLARGDFPSAAEALSIAAEAADALAAAHEAGVIHRDVKPANLLLTRNGRVKVSDFGVAKAIGEQTDLTRTGMMVGSPAYMAPEQVKGMALDGRSDLFSLGVVLFEMLLRRKPFPADTVTTLVYQILHEDPLEDVALTSAIGPGAAELLRWALAKDREARIPDARTFSARARQLASAPPRAAETAPTELLAAPPRVATPAAVVGATA
ncbi:MAG TPA: serine/threonine-protein kinase, partial [Thermoanaerobaculia bacterium]|nr:serine/threonine-protein kinase [Thermoanaerobaculia bacterium]